MIQKEFTAASYNDYLNEGKLMGSRCSQCGAIFLPPRPLCNKCHSFKMKWFQFKGNGKLIAFTAISVGPTIMVFEGFDRLNPYCSGIVELDEGPRISARIDGVETKKPTDIKIGTRLSLALQHRIKNNITHNYLTFETDWVESL